jgi:hypothetical protein
VAVGDICNGPNSLKAKHKQLFVVKQNRFNPPVQAVKKAIEEHRLGTLFAVQVNGFWNRNENYYQDAWRGTLDLDGGTLYTQFSHFIDVDLMVIYKYCFNSFSNSIWIIESNILLFYTFYTVLQISHLFL